MCLPPQARGKWDQRRGTRSEHDGGAPCNEFRERYVPLFIFSPSCLTPFLIPQSLLRCPRITSPRTRRRRPPPHHHASHADASCRTLPYHSRGERDIARREYGGVARRRWEVSVPSLPAASDKLVQGDGRSPCLSHPPNARRQD